MTYACSVVCRQVLHTGPSPPSNHVRRDHPANRTRRSPAYKPFDIQRDLTTYILSHHIIHHISVCCSFFFFFFFFFFYSTVYTQYLLVYMQSVSAVALRSLHTSPASLPRFQTYLTCTEAPFNLQMNPQQFVVQQMES